MRDVNVSGNVMGWGVWGAELALHANHCIAGWRVGVGRLVGYMKQLMSASYSCFWHGKRVVILQMGLLLLDSYFRPALRIGDYGEFDAAASTSESAYRGEEGAKV